MTSLSTPGTSVVNELQLTDSEIRFYQEEGYLYLGGLVKAEAVEALRQEILDVMEGHFGISEDDLRHASSAADKLRQSSQHLKGSLLEDLISGDKVKAVAAQLIGGPAHVYLPFSAVKAGGGGGMFHFHQDNNYTNHEPAMGSINIWVALVDMSPDNGCLQVVPRSHKGGQLLSHNSDDGDGHQQLEVDPLTCLPVRMRAGDAVAFTRWTVHGSGPNTTDQPRVAYALQFHRDDVSWIDKETGEKSLLVDSPRFSIGPVDRFERPE
ncbi:MAG: phytanoyl-CoA dioxygenase family protein [Planctomycetota bacterium]